MITGLETGGAQMSLLRLIERLGPKYFRCIVISLKPEDSLSVHLFDSGTMVYHLGMGWDPISLFVGIKKLRSILKKFAPHIIHGWMYHANLIGLLGARLLPAKPRVVWGIRHSLENFEREKRSTRWIIRLGAWLSNKPDRIIYNSYAAASQHRILGYASGRDLVIPNGIDCERFKPSQEARLWLRNEVLRLNDEDFLIGMVGRFHQVKGYGVFLKAAGILAQKSAKIKFLLVGKGVDYRNRKLVLMLQENGLQGKVYLMGERFDLERILPGLDLLCSASHAESFPNVVGEAMACGVPCVVTDVGDSARILGQCAELVQRENPAGIAEALMKIMCLSNCDREKLGLMARKRIRLFDCREADRRLCILYQSLAQVN